MTDVIVTVIHLIVFLIIVALIGQTMRNAIMYSENRVENIFTAIIVTLLLLTLIE